MVLVDYADENDKTIGSCEYEEVIAKKLTYREVLVLIFNENQELFLKKDGEAYGTSLRGILQKNEVYEDAALRLLKVDYAKVKESDLEFYSKDYLANLNGTKRFLEIYKLKHSGPFKIEGEFCSMKKIKRLVDSKAQFSDELKLVLKSYFRIKVE